MEQSGMSINVIPAADGSGDYGFLVSHTVWEFGRCQESSVRINEQVKLAVNLSGRPDNLLWMIDVLAMATELVTRAAGSGRLRPVRGANDKYRDTTEKPFLS
jgi:hypothetical protein